MFLEQAVCVSECLAPMLDRHIVLALRQREIYFSVSTSISMFIMVLAVGSASDIWQFVWREVGATFTTFAHLQIHYICTSSFTFPEFWIWGVEVLWCQEMRQKTKNSMALND